MLLLKELRAEPSTVSAMCPVCHSEVPAATIEDHVEHCLAAAETSAPRRASRWTRAAVEVDQPPAVPCEEMEKENKMEKCIENKNKKEKEKSLEKEKNKKKDRGGEDFVSEASFSKDVVQESAQDQS